MGQTYRFLAFDFGAESGRAILGVLEDQQITLEEIHRFPTEGITLLGKRQWDVTRIYGEMLTALRKYVSRYGKHLDGIGVDTWGVDFGLLASDGTLLANPVHYRDRRNEGAMEQACQAIGRDEIYRMTGIQFLPFNTAYQLYAMVRQNSPLLATADCLLMMGDLFTYFLCGRKACEYTNASTTQLLDPYTKTWQEDLIDRLGIPRRILLEPIAPGTVLGPVLPEIAAATGLSPDVQVIAPATHDTGAAIAAVPSTEHTDDWAYLSSGTWSLLGAELRGPVINSQSYARNFTNEGGAFGTIRFLKNIIGLWLLQECRRSWERSGQQVGYGRMTAEAQSAEPFTALIDVDDLRLLAPDDMPSTIQTLVRESGRQMPEGRGALVRCILESLALKYRRTLEELDQVLGRKTAKLHVIGGGVQNQLLCQMTADACGVPVLAGPIEATALGNIMVQAIGLGALASLHDARKVIARSFNIARFEPQNSSSWKEAASALEMAR